MATGEVRVICFVLNSQMQNPGHLKVISPVWIPGLSHSWGHWAAVAICHYKSSHHPLKARASGSVCCVLLAALGFKTWSPLEEASKVLLEA